MLGMRIVADIDVLGDASVQRKVARLSLALLAACAVAVLALALASGGTEPGGLWWWLALVASYVATLPVHELVHAAAFKLLSPGCYWPPPCWSRPRSPFSPALPAGR